MHKQHKIFFSFLIILLFASGCSPIATQGQSEIGNAQHFITKSSTIGQSFTSRHNGLDGMRVYFYSSEPLNALISLTIYDSPERKQILASGTVSINGSNINGYQDVILDQAIESYLKDLYFEFTSNSDIPLYVGSGSVDAYLDGSLYVTGSPETAQLTFQPLYHPGKLVWGLIVQASIWGLWLVVGLFLFFVPGFACLYAINGSHYKWPNVVWVAGAAAVSISLYPLLMLFTRIFNLQLGVIYAILPGAAGTFYLFYRWLKVKRPLPNLSKHLSLQLRNPEQFTTIVVIVIIIFVRFWAIRAIPLPMWGDTIHHTLIAQLMLDNGGLFDSWQPYAEMESMNYHFGFHSSIAVFSWLSGVSAPQATLVVGQLMNILAVLAIYPLAWKTAGKRKWAGIAALIVAGLLSPLPMFYVNWSRYTQLAGQVILPMAVFFLWEELEEERFSFPWAVIIGITAAGLGLTHYRVAVMFLAAIPAMIIVCKRKKALKEQALTIFSSGMVAVVLIAPWFIIIYGGRLFNHMLNKVSTPATVVSDFTQQYNTIGPLTNYLPALLWVILGIAVIYSIWNKQKGALLVLCWWFAVLLIANPALFNLPGEGAISNFAVFIAVYIPASVLIGAAFGELINLPLHKWPLITGFFLTILALSASVLYGKDRLLDVQPDRFALATYADVRAFNWLHENLPADSKILVNSFLAYGNSTVVGSDAGWWIPAMTGHSTSLPPILYGTEKQPYEGYAQNVKSLRTLAEEKGFTSLEFLGELGTRGIHYAFIGQKNGGVNYYGTVKLNANDLISSGYYTPIYHQDNVWVFEIAGIEN